MPRFYSLLPLIMIFTLVSVRNHPESDYQSMTNENLSQKDSFLMSVEDVFYINGRGMIATGKIERGIIKTGDSVEIIGATIIKSKVTAIEAFQKSLTEAGKEENVGLALSGVSKDQIKRGMVIARPRTVRTGQQFFAELKLNKSQGAVRISPIESGANKMFVIRTANVTGTFMMGKGAVIQPGDSTSIEIMLREPMALEKGLKFSMRDGGKTIGEGYITSVIK